ncbi:MAG: N-acetyl-D-Glu racemase DgcA [Pseudomonadota bacterium]
MPTRITITTETFPLAAPFRISRAAKSEAHVIVAEIDDGLASGRGECVPYAHYGETLEGVAADIARAFNGLSANGLMDETDLAAARDQLRSQAGLTGAARNALDCALFDLEAKRRGETINALLARPTLRAQTTCLTLSLDTPAAMAEAARALTRQSILKLKLGAPGDTERMAAVRAARPDATLIADANEGWPLAEYAALIEAAADARIALIEQPLPADADEALGARESPVPVCADEALHTRADLDRIAVRYDAINIKLDKTGGLTEALALAAEARSRGLGIMVGSMVATSLSMAPAMVLAQDADWVDLDSPFLLAADRAHGLTITDGVLSPPTRALWG